MISFDEAMSRMLAKVRLLSAESVDLDASDGRVLAQEERSDVDFPPFRKSAMDGYACRRADLSETLRVIEEIPAGRMPSLQVTAGTCSKIMTGAPVPEGADCVVMVEDTESCGEGRIRFNGRSTNDNICAQGEDLRAGDVVLSAGALIGPAELAVLAAAGCARPVVRRRPRVAVISTGSELCGVADRPTGASIRDSNSHQLAAQIKRIGAQVERLGIVTDDDCAIGETLHRARAGRDLIVVSGGVSAGDFDLVPGVLRKTGFELVFESVAMQPGRPTVFGDDSAVYVIGLPGNPVSTFVICELLLRPFLLALQGHVFRPRYVAVRTASAIRRKKGSRQTTVPVRFASAGTVEPVEYHGSAHIHAYTVADALLTLPPGTGDIPEGTEVHVRPL